MIRSLHQIKPGMVIIADVISSNQQVILKAGTKLESRHLNTLKAWDILDVEIDEASDPSPELQFSPDTLEIAQKEMTHWFRHSGNSSLFRDQLYRLCVLHRARQLEASS